MTGIPGYVIPKTPDTFDFFSLQPPQIGTWKPVGMLGCFMFNEIGQFIPFDSDILRKREEEANKPQILS